MHSLATASITFGSILGGALVGMWFQNRLQEGHLNAESKAAVNYVIGLMATLSALVLGLLISSSKSTFDTVNQQLRDIAAKTILIDRLLSEYGATADEVRTAVRDAYIYNMGVLAAIDKNTPITAIGLQGSRAIGDIEAKIRALPSSNAAEQTLQSHILQLSYEMRLARWTLIEDSDATIPPIFLAVLIFWLTFMFAGFGLYAPRNCISVLALSIGALAMATSIFLIEEMGHPFSGIITVSKTPMLKAFEILGK